MMTSSIVCPQGLLIFKEARKGFSLLQCLWNDGRLQGRIFNGVGQLYVSLQLYCWAILWGYLWRHISYHGNAQGPQKRPLNFSFCKLSEKLIRWPTIFFSLLESSLNSLTFQTVWKKFLNLKKMRFMAYKKFYWIIFPETFIFEVPSWMVRACKKSR